VPFLYLYGCSQCSRKCEWVKVWADYLFHILNGVPEEVQFPISDDDIIWMMVSSGHKDVILDEDDGIYEKSDKFKSFHHQTNQPMPRKTLLVDFLSFWLKKCVVSSPLHGGILSWVLFPSVQLAYGKPLRLLPGMGYCIQRDFWGVDGSFLWAASNKESQGASSTP